MRAFEVHLNKKKLCVAGIGDDGVLSAIVNWVTGKNGADLFLETGGLISPTSEHVSWIHQRPLQIGDTIQVKIVETDSIDEPTERRQRDAAKDLRAKKDYVRTMAKQLGWKILASPIKSGSRKKR